VLRHNERHNHAIERQRLTENEHNEHTDKQLVLIVRATDIVRMRVPRRRRRILIRNSGIPRGLVSTGRRKEGNLTGPIADRPNAVITDNPNAEPRRESGATATQTRTEMRQAGEEGIDIGAAAAGGGDGLSDDDADDEAVNANDSGHDNGNDVLHDRAGMPYARVHNTDA
jgi:hypothetical protein